MTEIQKNQLLHYFDYKLPQSHAKMKGGKKEQPQEYVLPGSLPKNLRKPVQRVEMKIAKKGGAGIVGLDGIISGFERQLFDLISSYVSGDVAQSLLNGILDMFKDAMRMYFSKFGGASMKQVKTKVGKIAKKGADIAIPIAKKGADIAVPIALDLGTNAATQAVANALLDATPLAPVAPFVGKVAQKAIRPQIKKVTGYGCQKGKKGVAEYKGKGKKPKEKVDKRKQRGQIIKKLMAENGLSFIQASKEASKHMK